MTDGRFDDLLDLLLEGDLGPEGVSELQSMLVQSDDLRREAAERLAEHRLLGLIHQPPDDAAAIDAVMAQVEKVKTGQVDGIMSIATGSRIAKAARPRWPVLAAACIATALLIPLVWTAFAPPPRGERTKPERVWTSPSTIASLLLCESCQWGADAFQEGQRIGPGGLDLRAGFAVLRFDGGAEVVVQGEVSLELLSPGSARLERGNVVVRAPDEAAGFTLLTPASELLDLGTEFSVRVGPGGATELDVLEGEVSVRPLESPPNKSRVFRAGHAVAVDTARSEPREIPLKSKRFAALVKDMRPSSRWELTHAYEGFFYDEGEVPLERSLRGKGWIGPWRARTIEEGYRDEQDRTAFLDIVHGRLNVPWPVPGGRLGMLRMPPGFTVRIRRMQRAIDLGEDGTYYVSFMLRVPAAADRHRLDDFRVTFRSTARYFGPSLSFGIPRVGSPRIQTGVGIGCRGRSRVPEDQSMLCVGKIDAHRVGYDRARFRVFAESDEVDCLEPREWDVDCRDLNLSAELDLAVVTSVGHAERIVDELRVGPTWRSVVPIVSDSGVGEQQSSGRGAAPR